MLPSVFGNGTDVVHWRASPTTRGTFDILTICVTTLLLCVWTAVHLNIAPPESVWSLRFRKTGWLILALIAPEMVAYTACMNEARGLPNPPSWSESVFRNTSKTLGRLKNFILRKQHNVSRQPTLEAQKPETERPWTMVHGFYAMMGGFAVRYPGNLPKSQRFLPSDEDRIWFLNRHFILILISIYGHANYFLTISEEEIKSKSNANGLAKTLACIQALWFVAQCLTRLIAHNPISLLELNTLGHAICALLIYSLWWDKPFEVDYPSFNQNQEVMDLFALFCMRTQSLVAEPVVGKLETHIQNHPLFTKEEKKIYENIGLVEESILARDSSERQRDALTSNNPVQHEPDLKNNQGVEDSVTVLKIGQTLPGTGWKIRPLSAVSFGLKDSSFFGRKVQDIEHHKPKNTAIEAKSDSTNTSDTYDVCLGYRDVNRWKMAWRVILADENEKLVRSGPGIVPENWFVLRVKDWPDINDIFQKAIGFGFCAAAFIYGGLHALAWSAHFASPIQRLLWQTSACVVVGGLPLICFAIVIQDRFRTWMGKKVWERTVDNALRMLSCLTLIAYVLARGYLVVECFIQLFNLPTGVFEVPQWTAYFPHIA